jgi:hypothetical protein
VLFLEAEARWVPTHELQNASTPFGFIGSAGHTRARELARNECPHKLKNKVDRAEGRDIGLDPRFTYFRYRREVTVRELLQATRDRVAAFDAVESKSAR